MSPHPPLISFIQPLKIKGQKTKFLEITPYIPIFKPVLLLELLEVFKKIILGENWTTLNVKLSYPFEKVTYQQTILHTWFSLS